MHSIYLNLLYHKNIRVVLQIRANAMFNNQKKKWNLIHDRTKKELCHFDWLIATDRLSGSQYHRDLSDVSEFTTSVRKIKSVQSLTAMVVFESSLNINIDSVQFTRTNLEF